MRRETLVYKQGDGYAIGADLYPGPVPGAPMVVFIHGGALIWGSNDIIVPEQVTLYHQAGFNVMSIGHRMAPESPLEHIVEDIRDVVRWVRREHSGKLAMVGSSAGGYLALLSGTFETGPMQ